MSDTGSISAIVLASDRGPDDPVAKAYGAAGKVLAGLGDRPILSHVLDVVDRIERVESIVLVCPDAPAYHAAVPAGFRGRRLDPADGPAASVARALGKIPEGRPVLVVTGDHPLVTAEWLSAFVESASATGCAAVVGLVDRRRVTERFPGNRRTSYRFSDIEVCGTNLFFFSGRAGRRAALAWRRFEADRKRPWRIMARVGIGNLLRYLTGRLSLDQALAAMSARFGARLGAVIIDHPEAAVDVDTLADLELVRTLMAQREARSA